MAFVSPRVQAAEYQRHAAYFARQARIYRRKNDLDAFDECAFYAESYARQAAAQVTKIMSDPIAGRT